MLSLGTLDCVLSDAADSKSSRLESEGGREARDLFPRMINDVSGDLDRYARGDRCKQQRRRNGPLSYDYICGFKLEQYEGKARNII